jgi:iron complex transport system permease protein
LKKRPFILNSLQAKIISLAIVLFLLCFLIIMGAGNGSVPIPPLAVFDICFTKISGGTINVEYPASWEAILFKLRLPRVFLGGLVGVALAIAGAVYQAIFKNPLAEPYLIGVSSGAAFGASMAIYFLWQFSWLGLNAVSTSAFIGALLTMFCIYGLSRVKGRALVTTLILAGVAIGSLLTAATTFMMFTAKEAFQTMHTLGWLMGSLALANWDEVITIMPYLIISLIIIGLYTHTLNVLQLHDEQAKSLGIKVEQSKLILICATTLATAAAVSVSGIIGFVGLVVPHIVRMIWGPDHRFLIPMSGILGACLVITTDILARIILIDRELPLGVVTAFVGAPFFIYLLRKQKRDIM